MSQYVGNILSAVGRSMGQYAMGAAVNAKNGTLIAATEAITYAVGRNNLSNAYDRMTEPTAFRIVRTGPNQAVVEAFEPYPHQRWAAAGTELSTAAVKVTALAMLTHGGICQIGTNLDWMAECEPLSITGINQAFYNGVAWTLAAGTKATLLAGEYVVLPTAKFTMETFVNHPVNSFAVLTIAGTLYSAAQDISTMHDRPTFVVRDGHVVVDTSNQKSFYKKATLGALAVAKATVAVALTVAAVSYNMQD